MAKYSGHLQRFVIVSQARSGSTMLGTAMGRHPQVIMHGEIFGGYNYPLNFYGIDERMPWPTPLEIALKKIRDRDITRFLNDFVFCNTARKAIGFKFKFEEFALWPTVPDFIVREKIKIIFLRRRNLLQRYFSEVEALATGSFNTTDSVGTGSAIIDVDSAWSLPAINDALEASHAFEQTAEKRFSDNPVLRLDYEDMISDWNQCFTAVSNFLGIVALVQDPISEKRGGSDTIRQRIDLNKVQSRFRHTKFRDRV